MSLSQTKEHRQVGTVITKQSKFYQLGQQESNMFFIALPVSDSVDFDQTAHTQEQSDLCLHPFLRPINPFGI